MPEVIFDQTLSSHIDTEELRDDFRAHGYQVRDVFREGVFNVAPWDVIRIAIENPELVTAVVLIVNRWRPRFRRLPGVNRPPGREVEVRIYGPNGGEILSRVYRPADVYDADD